MTLPLRTIKTTLLAICLIALSISGELLSAQESASEPVTDDLSTLTGNDLVKVEVHADTLRFQPGQALTLAVQYAIRPGWHIYWRNPGDNGMPPRVSVQAAPGVVVGEVLYPRPEIFQKKQETSFGYQGTVCLLVPLRITQGFDASRLDLSIQLEWLVCKDICLIGSEQVSLSIPAERPQRPHAVDPTGLRLVNVWRNRMPLPAAEARISAAIRGDSLLVSGPAGLSKRVLFIPELTPGVTSARRAPVAGTVIGRRFTVEIPLDIRPEDALDQPLRAAGLVLLGTYERPRAIAVDVPVPHSAPDESSSKQ